MPRVSDVSEQRARAASQPQSPAEAFHEAAGHLRELKAYAFYYLWARLDAIKGTARRIAVYALLGLVAAVAGVTLIVMAVVLAVQGLADLVNWALHFAYGGLSPWIGPLVVGLALIALLVIGVMVIVPRQFRLWRQRTVRKYEHKRRQQRIHLGHDVCERAAQERG
jgi:hypothetical protein